jgi:fructosamine-3-kinase
MSSGLSSHLFQILSRVTGRSDLELPAIYPVEGGSINATYQITTKNRGLWFCKINDSGALPDLFEKERHGLHLLGNQGIFRIPAVVACESAADKQVLILEWIDQGPKTDAFWWLFGEQLARLHRVTTPTPSPDPTSTGMEPIITTRESGISTALFGLDHDNYMGSLPQQNTQLPQWISFFIRRRLEPQVRLAAEKGLLGTGALRHFERLYQALPEIFPEEAPSLLHGDLWSGNFLCDENSRPVLIDPAVYFGHRSMDLAMTTLFGGFEHSFYESYSYHFPFPVNYREQWEVCNLYPLLVHLNLFGKSFLEDILHTIQRF